MPAADMLSQGRGAGTFRVRIRQVEFQPFQEIKQENMKAPGLMSSCATSTASESSQPYRTFENTKTLRCIAKIDSWQGKERRFR